MARTTKSAEEKSPFVELVSPDGSRKETPLNAQRDVSLRFQGYLPEDQHKLEAPAAGETSTANTLTAGEGEKTVGTNGSN